MNSSNSARAPLNDDLRRFLRGYSTEVTARDKPSLDAAGDLLPPGTEVFVAFLPKDKPAAQAVAAAQLRNAALIPVPHIVARNLADLRALDETLARFVGEAGVDRALVLGGDRNTPRGAFHSSLQLLETGMFEKHGVRNISIACYPEEHHRIPAATIEFELIAKLAAAERRGLKVALAGQFCFSAAPIIAMAKRFRAQGITAPIRVGVAAPADRATLIKYAMICGVGKSLRVLHEQQEVASHLLRAETPEALLRDIALAQQNDPSLGFERAHFFTFAALSNLTNWLHTLD